MDLRIIGLLIICLLISTQGNAMQIDQKIGRFQAYDFKARKDIPLKGNQLDLDVEYTTDGDALKVRGTLKNLASGERGIVLSYTIPIEGKDVKFSPSLNESTPEGEGSIYPIAAMGGLAMAIPPSAPCMFKITGSKNGLTLRMYLGLSPDTKVPNSADFEFIIYPCDPKWGFRDAARQYYAMYPDYYDHHDKGDGLWLFPSGLSSPPNIKDFLYHEIFADANIGAAADQDQKDGVLTFPYMIVGQREIKHLDKLPTTYEEAMADYAKWNPPAQSDDTKEALAAGGDIYLREEVSNSALKEANGNYKIMLRNTPWGDNSVTFIMNPNPDLPGEHTTGGDAMASIHGWLTKCPAIDGIYIDSLGANWVGKLNFRHDHFKYARYPLTFDADGNVCLHNQLSHCEFLDVLRTDLRTRDKLLMANGVYIYNAKEPEYADVTSTGRFFQAALVDAAGAESSSPGRDRWEFYRAAMGYKPYLVLKYHWTKEEQVQDMFNQAVCYDVFVTNSNNFDLNYWSNEKGYPRDKDLYAWYVPLVRTLSKAGWEPVTYASSPTEGVWFERYGKNGDVYFTLYNPGVEQECVLEVETGPLGLGSDPKVEQISGPGFVGTEKAASGITVRTKIPSKRTAVIHVMQNG